MFPTRREKEQFDRSGKGTLITGEASPYYICCPHAARRIRDVLPDVRLLAIFRNPADRAYSQFNHSRAVGFEHLDSFEEALDQEQKRIEGEGAKLLADENYESLASRNFGYCWKSRGNFRSTGTHKPNPRKMLGY